MNHNSGRQGLWARRVVLRPVGTGGNIWLQGFGFLCQAAAQCHCCYALRPALLALPNNGRILPRASVQSFLPHSWLTIRFPNHSTLADTPADQLPAAIGCQLCGQPAVLPHMNCANVDWCACFECTSKV